MTYIQVKDEQMYKLRSVLPMKKICYYPELVTITESITAALMMSQLEFWFKTREGKSFYKFLEPCEHERYKEGDSWQEELGMSSSEIRSAFKKIGMPYKSKKAFNEAEDIFKGKYYASYYDRIRKVTYYFRNTSKVKEVFEALEKREEVGQGLVCLQDEKKNHMEEIEVSDKKCSQFEEDRVRDERYSQIEEDQVRDERHRQIEESQVNDKTEVREVKAVAGIAHKKDADEVIEVKGACLPNLKDESSEDRNQQDGLCIQDFIYYKQLRRKEEESNRQAETHIPYLEILKVYNEELGAYLGNKEALSDREKESIKYLWFKLDKGVEDFRTGFKKVAESSFLCGRLEGKYFRASFAWLLKVEHFKQILAGGYDDFKSQKSRECEGGRRSMQKVHQFNQMASHGDWDFDEIERLERAYIDHKLASSYQQSTLEEAERSKSCEVEGKVGEGIKALKENRKVEEVSRKIDEHEQGEVSRKGNYRMISREAGEGRWANIGI